MDRGVSQLLFNYLPGRAVDWEDGLAVVKLGNVRLSSVWDSDRAAIVLAEVADQLDRWRENGGAVDPHYPDIRSSPGRFAVGEPESIQAAVLATAFICQRCSRLYFKRISDLRRSDALTCEGCDGGSLRQFGFVFVHGCGELIPVGEWIPRTKKRDDGSVEPYNWRISCPRCRDRGQPALPARSERVKDMRIVCRTCGQEILDRLTARCSRCLQRINRETGEPDTTSDDTPSLVSRIAMRVTRYNASDSFYPQSLSILRLDRPAQRVAADPFLDQLSVFLTESDRPGQGGGSANDIEALAKRLREAENSGQGDVAASIRQRIVDLATNPPETRVEDKEDSHETVHEVAELDILKSVRESFAFRTTVHSEPARCIAEAGGGASSVLLNSTDQAMRQLGLRDLEVVEDLPVIVATYGYTRRSFEPTYQELNATQLPTEIRVFPSIDQYAAQRVSRPEIVGTIPILAREGDHEGLYVSLDPSRVADWMAANGVRLESPEGESPIVTLLKNLEQIDRFHDRIWECTTRRLVFGLVHTLSHVIMRAASRFGGLQRTSLAEYVFLPLLGTVVYDNGSVFQLGGLRTLARDNLASFLEALPDEASSCLYDPDCIDRSGACHGCVHAPEICCRVFNHGLSRAFLLGGHIPWLDPSIPETVVGYWVL